MKRLVPSLCLVLALASSPTLASGQCMGGGAEGGHDHGEKSSTKNEAKERKAIRKLLASEESRGLLLEAILEDGEFMQILIGRIIETPEWRALAPDSARSPEPEHELKPEQALFRCPMHADQVSVRPGKCPKCGMDLVQPR